MIAMSTPKRPVGRPSKFPKPKEAKRSMERFQVSLSPELFQRLEAYRQDQKYVPERSEVIERALKMLLDYEEAQEKG